MFVYNSGRFDSIQKSMSSGSYVSDDDMLFFKASLSYLSGQWEDTLSRQMKTAKTEETPILHSNPCSSSSYQEKNGIENQQIAVYRNPHSNEPLVNFSSFLTGNRKYLTLRKKHFECSEGLFYPIGVVYDEKLKNWFVCDPKAQKVWKIGTDEEHNISNLIPNKTIAHPSAIMIYEEGCSIAVLSSAEKERDYEILIFNINTKRCKTFVSYKDGKNDLKYRLRGIAKSQNNNIVSVETKNGVGNLRLFKERRQGKSFEIFKSRKPSFIATCGQKVAVSDLETNQVYLIHLNDNSWESVTFTISNKLDLINSKFSYNKKENDFLFVCGLQFDKHGDLLIVDAKGRTVKLFDSNLTFSHRVSSNFKLTYPTAFWVNRNGEMLLLNTHGDKKMMLAKLDSSFEKKPFVR